MKTSTRSKLVIPAIFALTLFGGTVIGSESAEAKETLLKGVSTNIVEIQKFAARLATAKKTQRTALCNATLPKLLDRANKNYDQVLAKKMQKSLSGDRAMQTLGAIDLLARRYSCKVKTTKR